MASSPLYVDSAATGTGDGSTHANAFTTLAAALGNVTAPGKVLVNKTHNEAGTASTATTLTSPAVSQAAAVQILSVDFANNDADAVGAVVASPSGYSILFNGYARSRGVTYKSGLSIVYGSTLGTWDIQDTGLVLGASGAGMLGSGTTSAGMSRLGLTNTSLQFGNAGQSISLMAEQFTWRGGALAGSTFPTTLVTTTQAGKPALATIEAVDLSALPNTAKLAGLAAIGSQVTFKDCALPSGLTAVATGTLVPGCRVSLIRCANTAGNYVDQVFAYEGSEVDATNVTLSGGTDANASGGTPRSRLLTTTANATPGAPFVTNDIVVWIDVANSTVALTVEGIISGSAPPTNADLWIEAEYLGAVGNPLGATVSSGLATPQATPAAYPTSAATWSGTANVGSPATAFNMTVSFTPKQKGFVTLRVKAGKASQAFYYDAKPTVTVGGTALPISRSYVGPSGTIIHETGAITQSSSSQQQVLLGRRLSFCR